MIRFAILLAGSRIADPSEDDGVDLYQLAGEERTRQHRLALGTITVVKVAANEDFDCRFGAC